MFDSIIGAYEQFIFQRIVGIVSAIINPFICLSLLLMGYSLSNKMDNFLLGVRVINHKYIVVE